jgi:glyceraldehyde-3-phosphate dehydrogenase (NADP+)
LYLQQSQQSQECSIDVTTPIVPPFVAIPNPWLPASINVADLPLQNVVSYLRQLPSSSTCAMTTDTTDPDNKGSSTASSSSASIGVLQPALIGQLPQFDTASAVAVIQEARQAWTRGVWTNQFTLKDRLDAIRRVCNELRTIRNDLSSILQWDIGKNVDEANAEVDRTIAFIESAVELAAMTPDIVGTWTTTTTGARFFIKRAAVGIVLALAPFNYPLNECYATILPALIMGNIVVVKIPATGGLVHLRTFEAFAKHLPIGTIHFVAGSGRATMPPIMETGFVDALAFIGSSKAADDLIRSSPHPHRLKSFLQLEAKNLGIVLRDDRWKNYAQHQAVLKPHIDHLVSGALSFNGQRCTAIKLIFVPDDDNDDDVGTADIIIDLIVKRVQALSVGLPWQQHGTSKTYSSITPLPNHERIRYMKELLQDAVEQGATIYTGGDIVGGPDSTLMTPAVVGTIRPGMRLYTEEQFGPIVAIARYKSVEDILEYVEKSDYAQQVAIFGYDEHTLRTFIDAWGSVYGKIAINTPGRSPDTVPFSGRKSSALGVMSVRDALWEFSVPTVVAGPAADGPMLQGLALTTKFLQAP